MNNHIILDTGVSQSVVQAIDLAIYEISKPGDHFTELCATMRKNKSDKGYGIWGKHNYTHVYYNLFSERCNTVEAFLEIGLGTNNVDVPSNMGAGGTPGASLRGWREFFPNASIYGGDVDRRILFQEERITTVFLDQLSELSISQALHSLQHTTFDVILDDGLHRSDANINLHKFAHERVKAGGYYIIEDIECSQANLETFIQYSIEKQLQCIIVKLPHVRDITDNCFMLCEY